MEGFEGIVSRWRLLSLECILITAAIAGVWHLRRMPSPSIPPRTGFLENAPVRVTLAAGRTRAVIRIAGCDVRVDVARPGGGARRAAVLVIDDDLPRERGPDEAKVRDLVEAGFVVMVAPWGTLPVESRGVVFADLVDRLRRIRGVDPDRVGVVGIRGGAPLALAVATVRPHLRALALCGATMPRGFESSMASNLPRTLFVLGEEDAAAVATLNLLEAMLRERHHPYLVRTQEGVGANPSSEAREQAWSWIVAFLREFL